MDRSFFSARRLTAAAISLAIAAALVLQTTLNLERDGSPLVAFALLLRYFTIWSNLAAALLLGWIAAGRQVPQAVLFALATALTIVAIVYWALLAADHHPVGLDRITNQIFHSLAPAATIGWWLVFARGPAQATRGLAAVVVAPIIYTVVVLAYGSVSGFYPYFFLDRARFGWAQIAFNVTGLAMFFLAMGALLLGLRRIVSFRA